MKKETEKITEKPVPRQAKPKLANIRLEHLRPFPDHPYRVLDDESMNELKESIADEGLLNRILVRPPEDAQEEYEIISGHRRVHAAGLLGMKEVPAVIYFIDRDEATKMMVDANLQRENVSVMEKGRAYRMKLDAMKRQGQRTDLTSDPVGGKSVGETAEIIGKEAGDSTTQVRRFIRLTYLVPALQELADMGKLKLRPAVELSHLDEQAQHCVVNRMHVTETVPSLDQTRRLRKAFEEEQLNNAAVAEIMGDAKPKSAETLKIPLDDIRKYVSAEYTPQQISELAVTLLRQHFGKR